MKPFSYAPAHPLNTTILQDTEQSRSVSDTEKMEKWVQRGLPLTWPSDRKTGWRKITAGGLKCEPTWSFGLKKETRSPHYKKKKLKYEINMWRQFRELLLLRNKQRHLHTKIHTANLLIAMWIMTAFLYDFKFFRSPSTLKMDIMLK